MEKTTTARFCLAIGGKTDSLSFSVSLVQPILLCTFVLHHCQLLRLGHRQLTGDLGKANPKGGVKNGKLLFGRKVLLSNGWRKDRGKKKKATLLVTSSGNKSKRENIHRATVSMSESLSVIIQCLQFTFRDTGKHP